MRLVTTRLSIDELVVDRDLADLHEIYSDAETMRFWAGPVTSSPDMTARVLAHNVASRTLYWTVRTASDGPAVGVVALMASHSTPGLSWMLRRDHWGHGFATEAVAAVIAHAFEDLHLGLVEAWVDVANTRSLAVAGRLGLSERGRFAMRYSHRADTHEMVALGRLRSEPPFTLLAAEAVLQVEDVAASATVLAEALGCHVAYTVGDPVSKAGMRTGPWTTSSGFQLVLARDTPVVPERVYLHTGLGQDVLYGQVQQSGLSVVSPMESKPWSRREFTVALREGHEIVVSGPL